MYSFNFSYESRLAKYAKRGFAVAIPGFVRSKIDFSIYERPLYKLRGLATLLRLEMTSMYRSCREGNQKLGNHALNRRSFIAEMNAETNKFCLAHGQTNFRPRLEDRGLAPRRYLPVISQVFDEENVTQYYFEHRTHFCDYNSLYLPPISAKRMFELLRVRQYLLTAAGSHFRFVFGEGVYNLSNHDFSPDYNHRHWARFTRDGKQLYRNVVTGEEVTGEVKWDIPTQVSWITDNPGRQYVIGSFHPQSYDW